MDRASISGMTVAELRKKLTARGLDASGKKATLVKRLASAVADDGDTDVPLPQDNQDHNREREDRGRDPVGNMSMDELRSTIVSVMADTLPTLLAATGESTTTSAPVVQGDHTSGACGSTAAALSATSAAPLNLPTPGRLSVSTIPKRLVDRILTGEFINFNDLLPNVVSAVSGSKPSSTVLKLDLAEGGPFQFVEDSASRGKARHIHDLCTWLEAWTLYMHTILQVAPHRLSELLGYQALIVEANRRFLPEGWLDYDYQFRQAAAADTSLRWDHIEATIWQLTTAGKARPVCPSCSTVHPLAASGRCPFRPSRPAASFSSFSGLFQGKPICRNFNADRCYGGCSRAHVCHKGPSQNFAEVRETKNIRLGGRGFESQIAQWASNQVALKYRYFRAPYFKRRRPAPENACT